MSRSSVCVMCGTVLGQNDPVMMTSCHVSLQITMDLVALALYDVVLYCDDSGSMAFEEGVSR